MRFGHDLKPKALDKDLDKVGFLGDAAEAMGRRLLPQGLAICFLAICAIVAALQFSSSDVSNILLLVTGTAVGGYLAMNIGANDVANNVGPAVGARVVSITTALIIAAICESAGALLAGSDVVSTISTEIIEPQDIPDNFRFMKAMLTAMAAAAIWINIATLIGAPVSTTHTIVGGVVGAGVAASSLAAVNWTTFGFIAAGWVASPFLGGIAAALLMGFIHAKVIYTEDKLAAARLWLPILLGLLAATFTAYMTHKGLKRLIEIPFWPATLLPLLIGGSVWSLYRGIVAKQALYLDNRTQSLRKLFAVPLVCAAALLSFAHGANDVANAIGPLAAIVNSQSDQVSDLQYWILGQINPIAPLWISLVGAFGISAGLLLFGRRLVTVVGKRITKLNPIRAFCVTLAASGTVLTASGLGLPVSSTHIAVGAIFGVGLYREWYRNRYVVPKGGYKPKNRILNREERRRRLLVRRSNLVTIIGAWVVTVPASALLSAALFHVFDYLLVASSGN